MGKKKVIKKSPQEVLKEKEKIDQSLRKEILKKKKTLDEVRIYISSSYNNTIITLTDKKGNVLAWSSAGRIGFKGTRKATPFAASKVAEVIAEATKKLMPQKVRIFVKGIGAGRDSALRFFGNQGLNIISIKDITPIPHNGCRPPKPRRV